MGSAAIEIDILFYKMLDTKVFRLIKSFDNHIIRNLREDGIETRPASNGLWCCVLLPLILTLYALQYNVSLLYSILTCISIGLLAYCILFIIFMSVSCLVLKENIYGGCGAAGLVSTLLLYSLLDQTLLFSVTYSTIAVYMFSFLLRLSLTLYPKTFTIGEAMIVMQSVTLFIFMMIFRLFYYCDDRSDKEMKFVNDINFAFLSSVGIIVTVINLLDESQKNIETLSYVSSIVGTYTLVMLHGLIGIDCLIRIACYFIMDIGKLQLTLFWFAMTVLSVFVIMLRTHVAVKADTVTRKVFHVFASVVFMSGIVYDVPLITLAAGFGLGALILVETLRKSNIEKISPPLEAAFQVYCDEKDGGCFALTPMYLYVGLACPLLLVPFHKDYKLELLSGVLSIGVGDTAASWFGSKYGFNKWADGHKSLEGTAFNIMSQIATVYALEFFDLLITNNGLLQSIVAATLTGLVEAKTDQIDNLILPLIFMLSFRITWFMFGS